MHLIDIDGLELQDVPLSVSRSDSERLRIFGFLSSSTVLATVEPVTPDGPQLSLVGAPASVVLAEGVPI